MPAHESERWAELLAELGGRIGGLVRDIIPPDAQIHILNAQRELLTAMILIYEHQAGARRPSQRSRRRVPAAQERRRLDRISID